MKVWRAEPGDRVRLPCWPGEVTVTHSEAAVPGHSGTWLNRLHWEAPGAEGQTVLPDLQEIELLSTQDETKRVFMTPEREAEAG